MRRYIDLIPILINLVVIIFMSLVLNGIFDSEPFLDFRITYSKKLLLVFNYLLVLNFITGFVLNFNKNKVKTLLLHIIISIIYHLLIPPFYNKIAPW